MGYGTTLTPLLLLLGFGTKQIVPSVLLSEFVTGLLAGGLHHGLGNVRFTRGSRALKVALVLAACSIAGTLAAVRPDDLAALVIKEALARAGVLSQEEGEALVADGMERVVTDALESPS